MEEDVKATLEAEITDEDVVQAAFRALPSDRWQWCCDDAHIFAFYGRARFVATKLDSQFMAYNDQPENFPPDWRPRARSIKGRVQSLIVFLGPLVAERNRKLSQKSCQLWWAEQEGLTRG